MRLMYQNPLSEHVFNQSTCILHSRMLYYERVYTYDVSSINLVLHELQLGRV